MPVPLKYRLPNAPAVFVGRERETGWLLAAVERAPVSLVCGTDGVGKTALVLHTLQRLLPEGRPSLFVGVHPQDTTNQIRLTLLRALAEEGGSAPPETTALGSDPESLTEAAIDRAEAGRWLVVLDDVHNADAEEMNELLTQLASYARASRWIATSRGDPRVPTLTGQTLILGGLGDAELGELARASQPGGRPEELRKAISAASGSPWLLLQYLATGAAGVEVGREQLLGGLPEPAGAFLRALAVFGVPVPLEVLGGFAPVPDAETLQVLERRGLVAREGGGWRLHGVVRSLLSRSGPSPGPSDPSRTAAADALSVQDDPDLVVEGARLLLEEGLLDRLASLLAERGDDLIEQGCAPQLWRLIEPVRDPRLDHWRLRLAAELGSPTALSAVSEPPRAEPRDRLIWAQALHARGDLAAALELARSASRAAERNADAALAAEAALLLSRCLYHRGDVEGARSIVATDQVGDPDVALQQAAALALYEASLGLDEAERRLFDLRRQGEGLARLHQAAHDVALALSLLDRADEALQVLEGTLAEARRGPPSLLSTRRALLLEARLRLERGDLPAARSLADGLRPFARAGSLLRPYFLVLDLEQALAMGDLRGLRARLASAEGESGDLDCRARLSLLTTRAALLCAWEDGPLERAPAGRATEEDHALARIVRALHLRTPTAEEEAQLRATPRRLAARVIRERALSELALLAGETVSAVDHASEAVRMAERARLGLLEAESRLVLCDALAVARAKEALQSAALALSTQAERMGSPRFAQEARLFTAFASSAGLEPLALSSDVAPVAARRAQALLGGTPVLDRVDRSVLAALEALGAPAGTAFVSRAASGSAQGWEMGWGIDEPRRQVWLPDGREIDFSGRPLLWKVLTSLAAAGGNASKEEIVRAAWDEREYHPLRHDARVHVSVRKIRELIEDDPASPQRLLTTGEGYRLGGAARRVPAVSRPRALP